MRVDSSVFASMLLSLAVCHDPVIPRPCKAFMALAKVRLCERLLVHIGGYNACSPMREPSACNPL